MSGVYVVNNMSRNIRSRTSRATSPGRGGTIQRVCAGSIRLCRGDSVAISEDRLKFHYDELARLQNRGVIEVRYGSRKGPLVAFKDFDHQPTVEVSKIEEEILLCEIEEIKETSNGNVEFVIETEAEAILEPDKPIDKMNKQELISYAAEVLGEKTEELELLTKKQILEKLS